MPRALVGGSARGDARADAEQLQTVVARRAAVREAQFRRSANQDRPAATSASSPTSTRTTAIRTSMSVKPARRRMAPSYGAAAHQTRINRSPRRGAHWQSLIAAPNAANPRRRFRVTRGRDQAPSLGAVYGLVPGVALGIYRLLTSRLAFRRRRDRRVRRVDADTAGLRRRQLRVRHGRRPEASAGHDRRRADTRRALELQVA